MMGEPWLFPIEYLKHIFMICSYQNMKWTTGYLETEFQIKTSLYKFVEDNGRKFFLLYLKPIINGIGNYYIEAQTRDRKRTDIIVDYRGKQYIIGVKIWRGNEYNKQGEAQLVDYLDAYHAQKGYLLCFNFNKNKRIGTREFVCKDKVIMEVVV